MLRTAVTAIALCIASTTASAQTPLTGTWDGYWARNGDTMRVTLHIRSDTTPQRYRATFDAERLRVSGIPFAEVQLHNCCDVVLTLRGDQTTTLFNGTLRGDSLTGTFQEAGTAGTFAYTRARSTPKSFVEREVVFANQHVKLAASLLIPTGGNKRPAVVFVHGSGAEGRWASRFLAEQLATRGIASLIYDKRGVGASTGDWRTASLENLADDAAAAVSFLQNQPEIDSKRVGIHGHSQGGTLAPLIAARATGVAFVIGSAAAGMPTDSTEVFSILNSILPRATTARDSADARVYVGALVDVAYSGKPRDQLDPLVNLYRGRPWFFAPPAADNAYWAFSPVFGKYRPLEWWSRVKVPVLLIYGAEDQRVPARESAARITEALQRAGNRDVVSRIFADADHTFRLPPGAGGWPRTAPGYLRELWEWIGKR